MRLAPIIMVAAMASTPGAALAHQVGLSSGRYEVTDDGIRVGLVFARGELIQIDDRTDTDGDDSLSETELSAATGTVTRAFVDGLLVRSGDRGCPGKLEKTELTEEDGLLVVARYACSNLVGRVDIDVRFLRRLATGHRHVADARSPVSRMEQVLFRGNQIVKIPLTGAATEDEPSASIGALFVLGIEHILIGWDHLAFLFGLILVGGRLRAMLAVVTAFTVGHSITLGLASLGVWTPSPSVIEPLIALSIVYVGVENFFIDGVDNRWYLTGLFGLVHGFGFAGVLAEIGLPSDRVLPALLSFNLGVEAGQVAALLVVVPILAVLRKNVRFATTGVRALNVVLIALGGFWFFDRVL